MVLFPEAFTPVSTEMPLRSMDALLTARKLLMLNFTILQIIIIYHFSCKGTTFC